MKFQQLKTKYQLLGLTLACILLVVVIEIYAYVRMTTIVKEKAVNYAESGIIQLDENINVVTGSVRELGFNIAYEEYVQKFLVAENYAERVKYMDFVTNLISKVAVFNKDIVDITLIDNNQNINSFLDTSVYTTYKRLHQKYNFTDENFREPVFVTYFEDVYEKEFLRYAYIIPIFWTTDEIVLNKKIGSMIVISKAESIKKFVESISQTGDEIFYIQDKNNQYIFSNKNKEEIEKAQQSEPQHITIRKENTNTNWDISVTMPIASVTEDISFFSSIVICIGIIMILLLVGFMVITTNNITNPMEEIIDSINKIGEKNIKQRLNGAIKGEFGIIARKINEMLDKIENMTKKIFTSQKELYEVELSHKQVALSALQSQINPHFLYNTLECIRSIATVYRSKEIAVIATNMAKVFRYSIKADDMVTVNDEIEIIKNYLKIIDIRFCGKITYEIEADPDILEYKIPKMILQPIVENAVYHGLGPKLGEGVIAIRGLLDQDKIIFMIEDNGVGLDEEMVRKLNRRFQGEKYEEDKNAIGLYNIQKRIKLALGSKCAFHIESQKAAGTTVTIRMPVVAAGGWDSDAKS